MSFHWIPSFCVSLELKGLLIFQVWALNRVSVSFQYSQPPNRVEDPGRHTAIKIYGSIPREGFKTNQTLLISSSPRLQNMSVFLRIQVRTNSQSKAENGEQDWGEVFISVASFVLRPCEARAREALTLFLLYSKLILNKKNRLFCSLSSPSSTYPLRPNKGASAPLFRSSK